MSNLAISLSDYKRTFIQTGTPISILCFKEEVEGKFVRYMNKMHTCILLDKKLKRMEDDDLISTYEFDRDYVLKKIGFCSFFWLTEHENSVQIPDEVPKYFYKNPNTIEYRYEVEYEHGNSKLDNLVQNTVTNLFDEICKSLGIKDHLNSTHEVLKQTTGVDIYLQLIKEISMVNPKNSVYSIILTADSKVCNDKDLDDTIE